MKKLGLYLHIPFCRSKCLYCDFCSFPRPSEESMSRYTEALCRDLEERHEACSDYEVDTVYLGGGTPTVLPADSLARILETVAKHYHITTDAEITSECNPATAQESLFRSMRGAGFNRLSIGVQSAQAEELRALGRLHSFSDVCRTWEEATDAGFENLSADLMFGIPHQTNESFLNTLERVSSLSPKHLSAYALTVEEHTPFGRRGEDALNLPNEDAVRRMYQDAVDFLAEQGLYRYEISNFAAKGYESRHNLKYWNTDEYLGFGPAAHSDFGGERFGNGTDLFKYLAGESIEAERSCPDGRERMNEYIMLRMRLEEGIFLDEMARRFGETEAKMLADQLQVYCQGGFVRATEVGFAFTTEGMLVSNGILSDLLDF